MVGKTVKSSGRMAYTDTNKTTSPKTILKVNNISSISGGNGITTIASIMITMIGAARPCPLMDFKCPSTDPLAIVKPPLQVTYKS
jgi:hypothetical protein